MKMAFNKESVFLWIDFRFTKIESDLEASLNDKYKIYTVTHCNKIDEAIELYPIFFYFEKKS